MILRPSGFLGLAFGERAIACTELSVSGDRRVIRRMATFTLPEGVLFEQADAAGQLFATFLRQERFSSSRAIVGVPARWLLAVERDVPPSDATQVRSILRLHAERMSGANEGEMVFDYTGRIDTARGGKVLLIGILRQQLDRIGAMLDAAGITVAGITPTSLALASSLVENAEHPMLLLGRQSAEIIWQKDGTTRLLRHVAVGASIADAGQVLVPLASELRRAVALAPSNGTGPARELLVWDSVGLSQQQLSDFTARLGVSVRSGRGLAMLGIQDETGGEAADQTRLDQFAPSAALALAGVRRSALPVDFRHSRLTPEPEKRIGRRSMWAATVSVLGVIGIMWLYWGVQQRKADLESLTTRIEDTKPDVEAARHMLGRVSYARGYFDARPPMLECLREIALAFHDDDPIWATSVNIHGDGKAQLIGKAADQKAILALRDRLQKNPALTDVRAPQMNEVSVPGGKSREQSFTIGFTFTGME